HPDCGVQPSANGRYGSGSGSNEQHQGGKRAERRGYEAGGTGGAGTLRNGDQAEDSGRRQGFRYRAGAICATCVTFMKNKNDELLKKLRATFRVEADTHLQTMAAGLLALEKTSVAEQPALVEAIFRAAHSLKGAARAV